MQRIHYRQYIGRHQIIRVWSSVARAAAMAAAVDQNRTAATTDQCWNLITPVATMAKTAMEQDYRRTRSVSRIPDPSAIMFHIALIICRRQRSGPVSFEPPEVVIVNFHADLSPALAPYQG